MTECRITSVTRMHELIADVCLARIQPYSTVEHQAVFIAPISSHMIQSFPSSIPFTKRAKAPFPDQLIHRFGVLPDLVATALCELAFLSKLFVFSEQSLSANAFPTSILFSLHLLCLRLRLVTRAIQFCCFSMLMPPAIFPCHGIFESALVLG